MSSVPWTEALVYAVTGERIAAVPTATPDLDAARRAVASASRDPAAVAAERAAVGEPWPYPLPPQLRAALPSLAQFYAALQRLTDALDVSPHPMRAQRAPDADERRLLADRPPHWGRVG